VQTYSLITSFFRLLSKYLSSLVHLHPRVFDFYHYFIESKNHTFDLKETLYFPVARKIFEEADDILGFALSKITFTGTEEVLRILKIFIKACNH
jgi:hypothetical protein